MLRRRNANERICCRVRATVLVAIQFDLIAIHSHVVPHDVETTLKWLHHRDDRSLGWTGRTASATTGATFATAT